MKVYVDNDVVSALRRWDHSQQENAAIRQMKDRSDNDEITLLVSLVHDREAARLPEVYKRQQEAILAVLPKAVFVERTNG